MTDIAVSPSSIEALLAVSPIEPFVRILARLADQLPDAPAVTFAGVTTSRSQLERRANRLARAYAAHGVGLGDLVTIGLPNGTEFVAAFIACLKLGATPQPTSPKLPLIERQAIIALADSKLVLGFDAAGDTARVYLPIGFEPPVEHSDEPLPEVISPAWKAATSGGSTGRPKLIVAGSGAVGSPLISGMIMQMAPTDVQVIPGPLYHNAPMTNTFFGLLLGQHVVVLSHFDAHELLDTIERERVSFVQLVPTMMLRMLRVIEAGERSYDLSSLRIVWHMASKCPDWLKDAWLDLVEPQKVLEMYGGTEIVAFCVINGAEWREHRGSVGRVVFGEMKVLDEQGEELPRGEVGEIYMKRPEGSDPTYRYIGADSKVLEGGWESLGDLGSIDSEGYVYVADRRVDMIICGGANIYPAEVENALDEHPGVLSSVVIGLPDDDLGQRVHALVEVVAGTTSEDLIGHLNGHLVRFKIPRSFEFIDAPLRDDAGKVRRSLMREEAIARMGERV